MTSCQGGQSDKNLHHCTEYKTHDVANDFLSTLLKVSMKMKFIIWFWFHERRQLLFSCSWEMTILKMLSFDSVPDGSTKQTLEQFKVMRQRPSKAVSNGRVTFDSTRDATCTPPRSAARRLSLFYASGKRQKMKITNVRFSVWDYSDTSVLICGNCKHISLSFYPSTFLPDTSVHPWTHVRSVFLLSKLNHLVKEHSPLQA